MADIRPLANPLFLREEELREGIEMLFYAQRDFAGADPGLTARGLGRTHQRIVYFVGRHPGLTVTALLGILRLTKQSLSRILAELAGQGLIVLRPGPQDRRQRAVELTPAGAELERQLSETQRNRLARAYRAAGAEAVDGFRKVLLGLIDEAGRARFARPAERK